MSAGDDPKPALTIEVLIIGVILLLAVVILAQVIFYNTQRMEDERKLIAGRPQELAELQFQQLEPISGYRYVDEKQGVVAIPIDDAIPLFVARQKSAPAPATMSVPGPGPAPTTQPDAAP